jgi:hypothetical protein
MSGMTLDEAIKHAEEKAKEHEKMCQRYDDASGYSRSHNETIRTTAAKKCEKCAEEHRQLAEWLKDYQRLLEQEPCEDAISRQATIEAFQMFREYEANRTNAEWVDRIETVVKKLSSVNPQPKTRHWIFVDKAHEHAHCSECDYGNVDLLDGRPHNYCPNCGCRMAEPQERSLIPDTRPTFEEAADAISKGSTMYEKHKADKEQTDGK